MSAEKTFQVGDRIVLLPKGRIGVVQFIDYDAAKPYLVFDSLLKKVEIPLKSTKRYRKLFSAEEADTVEEEICASPGLPGFPPAGASADRKVLERHLESKKIDDQILGVASLLDWSAAAWAQGEQFGPWKGCLGWSRDFLLGELALVRGVPHAAYCESLAARRLGASKTGAPVAVTHETEAPVKALAFGEAVEGANRLGTLQFSQVACLVGDPPIEETEFAGGDDHFILDVIPGEWLATMHVYPNDPVIPAQLLAALERGVGDEERREEIVDELEVAFMGGWMVFERAGQASDRPAPRLDAVDELVARMVDSVDPAALVWEEAEGLSTLAIVPIDGGQFGVLTSTQLSDEQAFSIRESLEHETALWSWGLRQSTGGDGDFGVYVRADPTGDGPVEYFALRF